jgi:hypothetical protein
VVRVGAIELELGLQGNAVGQADIKTLIDGVARRVDIIVKEFKLKVVARILDGEILGKNFIESLVFSFLSRCIQLQEITESL